MDTAEEPRDRGSAMIITLMVLALVTALSTTVAVVTIDNMIGSRRAQEAGAALASADAGIAQAMTYLRNNGVRDLQCTEAAPAADACKKPWGSAAPQSVTSPGALGQAYSVWIEAVDPYPAHDPGLFRIHSTGTAGQQASRAVVTDVTVTTSQVPKGIFAKTVNGGGNASVARESVFSTGCVSRRKQIKMIAGLDVAYGIPVAVHSSLSITDSNGCTAANGIHEGSTCAKDYPYDQDSQGGNVEGTDCNAATAAAYATYYGKRDLNGDGVTDVHGSFIKDDATLFDLFDIHDPVLSQAQIDRMKTIAQAQGNYWTSHTGWTSPGEDNAVMFFDLGATDPGSEVDLNDVEGFSRTADLSADNAACTTKSLVIVIDGGNAKLNSNQSLVASLFLTSPAPYGKVSKANGTSNFVGTIYADEVNLVGTTDLSLDSCFLANMSPALLDFNLGAYRELDR